MVLNGDASVQIREKDQGSSINPSTIVVEKRTPANLTFMVKFVAVLFSP